MARPKNHIRNEAMRQKLGKTIKEMQRQGWTLQKGGRHDKFISPEGKVITLSSTPSDHRAVYNMKSDLRRYSVE